MSSIGNPLKPTLTSVRKDTSSTAQAEGTATGEGSRSNSNTSSDHEGRAGKW